MPLGATWVLLDVGNVLIGFDHARVSERLRQDCVPREGSARPARDALDRFIFAADDGPSRNIDLDEGRRDLRWLREALCGHFGVDVDEATFAAAWNSIFDAVPHAAVVEVVAALQLRGVEVALCSSTNRAHWQYLLEAHSALRRLSESLRCFLSFELGCGKTNPDFFPAIAVATAAPPHHHVLVDDRAENCAAAVAAGMRAVLFDAQDVPASVARVMVSAAALSGL